MTSSTKRVAVVVIGDVGRSPRMQYHALSLANQAKCEVDLIGYQGTDCWPAVSNHSKITLHLLPPPHKETEEEIAKSSWLERKVQKVFAQIFNLFWLLMTISSPDYILVQTPPAIPILLVAHVVCWLRWTRLVIDWHNYGYTILNITKKGDYSVSIYKFYETIFGRGAYGNLCVSNAMKKDLHDNWGVDANVLYDRPPSFYKSATLKESHQLFSDHPFGKESFLSKGQNAFTMEKGNEILLKADRPVLLVSSTSWTADEDFGILLDALVDLNNRITNSVSKFHVRLVVTGIGDLREEYEAKMESHKLKYVKMFTGYLPYNDYRVLLGSADLGICLHASSSGVDLPMKVVDMFGCGLPVCAVDYPALSELVKSGENGLIFKDSEELASQIYDLCKDFPKTHQLYEFKEHIQNNFNKLRWDECWEANALPLFQ